MPARRKPGEPPPLRRHAGKACGYAVFGGRFRYFGGRGSWPEGEADPPAPVLSAYNLALAGWLQGGDAQDAAPGRPAEPAPDALSVAGLVGRWRAWAEGHYRDADGNLTSEYDYVRLSVRPLLHLFGDTPAAAFGPSRLKALRALMVSGYDHPERGPQRALSRPGVNARVRRVVRVFRWAVAEELVPPSVHEALRAVAGLQRGRTAAPETEPVTPAPEADVAATLPFLRPPAAAMVRLQGYSGIRPGEACRLRACEIDRRGDVWRWSPARHKTAHRGRGRAVFFGPRAQAVILGFVRVRCPACGLEGRPPALGSRDGARCGPCADRHDEAGLEGPWPRREVDLDRPLFSPARDQEERSAERRARRKTRVQPSQKDRRAASPKAPPRDAYDARTYGHAVYRACRKAGVAPWAPNQVRHSRATAVRAAYGLEAAQVALGHARADVTQVYAERDHALAERVARETG